jgi:hypothetical protein
MTSTATEPITQPLTGDAPPCWPPLQHIVRNEDKPVREGTLALCGEKLMGLDLGSLRTGTGEVCAKCVEAFKRAAERETEPA